MMLVYNNSVYETYLRENQNNATITATEFIYRSMYTAGFKVYNGWVTYIEEADSVWADEKTWSSFLHIHSSRQVYYNSVRRTNEVAQLLNGNKVDR